jgi:uncharacterized protein YqjF (DUF2071 family)
VASDFDFGIVQDTAHRPWPMPAGPWIMTQSWHDLLFAHWAVPAPLIAAKLPSGLELDLFDGRAWIGVVPFWMSNVSPRGVPPLPGVSTFPELNVRTYVTVDGRRGVYFFSLDADNPLAVAGARALFGLPYYWASMRTRVEPGAGAGGVGVVHYESDRPASREPRARFVARYWPVGPCFNAQPGTLEYFLTERYCLYTTRGGQPMTVDIHHRPWPLLRADADIQVNTMAEAAGVPHGSETPVLHFVKRLDVVAWPPRAMA